MLFRTLFTLPAAALGLLWFAPFNRGDEPPPVPAEEGLEFLGRGPIHEAYAQPVDPTVAPVPTVPREPPTALQEDLPEERPEGDDLQWVPGYWQWDDERQDFIWVSGCWRKPPPGKKWAPGEYVKVEDGWERSPGFWVS